jgi:hypothetical protein
LDIHRCNSLPLQTSRPAQIVNAKD